MLLADESASCLNHAATRCASIFLLAVQRLPGTLIDDPDGDDSDGDDSDGDDSDGDDSDGDDSDGDDSDGGDPL
jgi:hypothetical protein